MAVFTFDRQAGADKFAEWCRLYEELLAGDYVSLTHNGDRLAAFLDVTSDPSLPVATIAGKPTNHVESWRTNCAMTQHAGMIWMRRAMKPMVNGQPITAYLELTKGGDLWVPNDGKTSPAGPCIFYVEPSPRLGFDHVGAFGAQIGDRQFATYEGGGGDGTKVGKSSRYVDRLDAYGRRISGWWTIAPLLPDFDKRIDDDKAYPAAGDEIA